MALFGEKFTRRETIRFVTRPRAVNKS